MMQAAFQAAIDKLLRERVRYRAALENALEYFDQRADAETNHDGTFTPNAEMKLACEIQEALGPKR